MSTEFYVLCKDIPNSHPFLQETKSSSEDRIILGRAFANGDRKRALECLLHEHYGEWAKGTFSDLIAATISELQSSAKPYFSKWSEESEIEFFNTKTRFSWHTRFISFASQNDEEDEAAMIAYWNSLLKGTTPLYHHTSHPIFTWKDLKEALFGPNRYVESSRFIQGEFLQ